MFRRFAPLKKDMCINKNSFKIRDSIYLLFLFKTLQRCHLYFAFNFNWNIFGLSMHTIAPARAEAAQARGRNSTHGLTLFNLRLSCAFRRRYPLSTSYLWCFLLQRSRVGKSWGARRSVELGSATHKITQKNPKKNEIHWKICGFKNESNQTKKASSQNISILDFDNVQITFALLSNKCKRLHWERKISIFLLKLIWNRQYLWMSHPGSPTSSLILGELANKKSIN